MIAECNHLGDYLGKSRRSARRPRIGGPNTSKHGIGVIFDTRKGYFRYKISSYIVIYHNALIVYHCVSLCINVVYTIYHVPRRHDISTYHLWFLLHVISFDIMSRI